MQRACAGRRDLQVREQSPIGIDFLRRERPHGFPGGCVGGTGQGLVEEPRIAGDFVGFGIGRNDEQQTLVDRADSDVIRDRRPRQSGQNRR